MKYVPEGVYCYSILKILDNGMGMKVRYCSYRDGSRRNKCGEPYCKKVKGYIEDDCKICRIKWGDIE